MEQEPQYMTVSRVALKFLDRVKHIEGINEAREFVVVWNFLSEIADGKQEVKEINNSGGEE